MKVAITGAMGLIGNAIIEKMTYDGISLTCLARSDIPKSSVGVRWLQGDLNEEGVAEKLVADQDVIIHLAHDSTPLSATFDLIAGVQRSLFPSLRLIQAIAATGNKPHVIYLSSGGAIYGSSTNEDFVPFHETEPCTPILSYGIQKLTTERYFHNAAANGLLRATILRVSNAYGGLLPAERMQGLIGTSISRVLAGMPLRLIGNPQNIRDYVHISDIVLAIQKTLQLKTDFEIINIGSGVGYSVLEVLGLILEVSGCTVPIHNEEVSGSKLLPNWCVLDVGKARNMLRWEAGIALGDGIASMIKR